MSTISHSLTVQTDLIITGDDDLLTLNAYQNIPMVTAAEAMRRIEDKR